MVICIGKYSGGKREHQFLYHPTKAIRYAQCAQDQGFCVLLSYLYLGCACTSPRARLRRFILVICSRWSFETKAYDLGFGIYLQTNPEATKLCDMTPVLPVTRVNSHLVPEDGYFTCGETGICEYTCCNSRPRIIRKLLAHCFEFYAWGIKIVQFCFALWRQKFLLELLGFLRDFCLEFILKPRRLVFVQSSVSFRPHVPISEF